MVAVFPVRYIAPPLVFELLLVMLLFVICVESPCMFIVPPAPVVALFWLNVFLLRFILFPVMYSAPPLCAVLLLKVFSDISPVFALSYRIAPATLFAVFCVKLFCVIVLLFPSMYNAPPVTFALFCVKMLFLISVLFDLICSAPARLFAWLLVKLFFSRVIFSPSMYNAPPEVFAILPLNVLFLICALLVFISVAPASFSAVLLLILLFVIVAVSPVR